jgi:hypothetical protein
MAGWRRVLCWKVTYEKVHSVPEICVTSGPDLVEETSFVSENQPAMRKMMPDMAAGTES